MRLTFEDCLFDSDTREVFRGGSAVPLSPKAFRLLELLIRNRPKAVAKKEIREHLWPATFVSDANLGNLIAELRAALGDDARRPKIIRTVPRFGYAFRAKTRAAREKGTQAPAAYRLIWGNREVDLEAGVIRNFTKGDEYRAEAFPEFIRELIDMGGLVPWVRRRLEQQGAAAP